MFCQWLRARVAGNPLLYRGGHDEGKKHISEHAIHLLAAWSGNTDGRTADSQNDDASAPAPMVLQYPQYFAVRFHGDRNLPLTDQFNQAAVDEIVNPIDTKGKPGQRLVFQYIFLSGVSHWNNENCVDQFPEIFHCQRYPGHHSVIPAALFFCRPDALLYRAVSHWISSRFVRE
jgi:hypothetical protein